MTSEHEEKYSAVLSKGNEFVGLVGGFAIITFFLSLSASLINWLSSGWISELTGWPASNLHIIASISPLVAFAAFGMALAFRNLVSPYLSKRSQAETDNLSTSISLSAAERQMASSADAITRDFQARIDREMNAAVERVMTKSESLIKQQLATRIDQQIGRDIISILGDKLAEQTNSLHQTNNLRQHALDQFDAMRRRALQYAEGAAQQAAFYRRNALYLAVVGLLALAVVLFFTQWQFHRDPALMEKKLDWTMLLLRNAPSYTFVLLCEFLALLMFRYQSKSLEYMRYFSNEATNIDARAIAFTSAIWLGDNAVVAKLVARLELTERNFLIGKDQRTIELANNETEDQIWDKVRQFMPGSIYKDGHEKKGTPRGKNTKGRKPEPQVEA